MCDCYRQAAACHRPQHATWGGYLTQQFNLGLLKNILPFVPAGGCAARDCVSSKTDTSAGRLALRPQLRRNLATPLRQEARRHQSTTRLPARWQRGVAPLEPAIRRHRRTAALPRFAGGPAQDTQGRSRWVGLEGRSFATGRWGQPFCRPSPRGISFLVSQATLEMPWCPSTHISRSCIIRVLLRCTPESTRQL